MNTERNDGRYSLDGTYVVRMYDRFEREWIDVSPKGLSLQEAATKWDKETNGGQEHTQYEDGYYYDVFPDNTTMLYSYEVMGEH